MMPIKKSAWFVLIGIVLCVSGVFVARVFSQGTGDFSSVSFAADGSFLKFFDHDSGKIYVYSSKNGDLINTWILGELGEDLIAYNPKIPDHLKKELQRRGYH